MRQRVEACMVISALASTVTVLLNLRACFLSQRDSVTTRHLSWQCHPANNRSSDYSNTAHCTLTFDVRAKHVSPCVLFCQKCSGLSANGSRLSELVQAQQLQGLCVGCRARVIHARQLRVCTCAHLNSSVSLPQAVVQ